MKVLPFIVWNNGVHYLLMLTRFKKAYENRVKLRADFERTGEYNLLWGMLHNELDENRNLTNITCDYGDADFYKKNFVSISDKDMYKLAFKWAKFNPNHNRYYFLKEGGIEGEITGTATSKIQTGLGTWRTFITKDEQGNPAWKHGSIIDFENSHFGKQDIKFNITKDDGTIIKAYRKSTCLPFKLFGRIYITTRRTGYENNLPQVQFALPSFKGKTNLDNYKAWKKLKWIKSLFRQL